jgi:hypothetical protein
MIAEQTKCFSFLKNLRHKVRKARHHGRKKFTSTMAIGVKILMNHPRLTWLIVWKRNPPERQTFVIRSLLNMKELKLKIYAPAAR